MHTPAGFVPAHAMPAALPATALVFAFRGDRILVGGDEKTPSILTHCEFAATGLDGPGHYLGEYQGVHCVARTLAEDANEVDGLRYAGLRSLFFAIPEPLVAIAARAFQVIEWDRTHRFCGRCGTRTRDKPGERAKECENCGYVAYPRVSPAMMALVTRGRDLLLARAHRFPQGMYSALAGFVEPGETIEDCIVREVREEVGVEVTKLRVFREPVVVVPALADDRVHRGVRRRRNPLRRHRDRRGALVSGRRATPAAAFAVDRAASDRCDGAEAFMAVTGGDRPHGTDSAAARMRALAFEETSTDVANR